MKREIACTYTVLTINKNSLFEHVSRSSKYPLRMVVRFTDCIYSLRTVTVILFYDVNQQFTSSVRIIKLYM